MRYGASGFMSGWEGARGFVAFQMEGRRIRFDLIMPNREDFRSTPGGRRERSDNDTFRAWKQGCRQSWRALALVIKAKLEAIASGISCFEDEFMAHIVMPDGKTVSQHIRPGIAAAYATGKMPLLLPNSV